MLDFSWKIWILEVEMSGDRLPRRPETRDVLPGDKLFLLEALISRYQRWMEVKKFAGERGFAEVAINCDQEMADLGRKIASYFTKVEVQ